ncbi:MarR family transcriptional regulator [Candidatus Woesearchaeota archaeon]|nr:MarR family transcriptional regulator [Candidatus Woesearchaeota archaeon]
MQPKTLAFTLILASIVLAGTFYGFKLQEDKYIEATIASNQGSCFVDGICLYESRSWVWYIIGWSVSAFLLGWGIYLYFFDKSQTEFKEYQQKVSASLAEAKKTVEETDKWKAFLSGFTEDEQKVLVAIKEQDGIQQSTLRYRTGLSKATLSLMLKNFEEKGLISREEAGKTNKVFWKKVY